MNHFQNNKEHPDLSKWNKTLLDHICYKDKDPYHIFQLKYYYIRNREKFHLPKADVKNHYTIKIKLIVLVLLHYQNHILGYRKHETPRAHLILL